ncbi:hypothetical protein ABZ023_32885 [Streptomyces sp. NPDC006367]|uniref:hypothetical protein n=1 Tax=unclassified Streptomyces TaxID=2593676 RepID=UPI0033A1FAE7
MPVQTVTVCAVRGRYTAEFSVLPGRTFGPWDMHRMLQELRGLLDPFEARNLVFDAAIEGTATAPMS